MWKPKPINILLVDDREDGLFTLETILKCPEYNLIKASSGDEALKCMLNDDFALVLLDVQMPGLNGFETASLIRARKKSRYVPIIFVTAINKEDVFIDKGYESGAVDYIFKPFNPTILKSKVSVFVELYQKNQQLQRQASMIQEQEKKAHEQKLIQLELKNLRRYENLANSIPHMVWRSNALGNMEYFNEIWVKYTGLSADDCTDNQWHEYIHPDDLQSWLECWKSAIENNESSFEEECRILNAHTQVYGWFLVKAISEYNSEGELVSWLGTITDIQDSKESDQQKAAFLSVASHEFKSPLTAVSSSIEAALQFIADLKSKSKSEEEDEKTIKCIESFLNIGMDSISDVNKLLDDFLDFSRVESGRLPINASYCNLTELISRAIQSSEAKIQLSSHLTMSSEIAENVFGYWDPYRVRQVVENLISNAIKYSPNKGNIHISLSQESNVATIKIKDEGIGIEQYEHKKIFKPFTRSQGVKHFSGMGIGLYISSWIIEEHEGKIEVESAIDQGSEFKIYLPIKIAEAQSEINTNC